MPGIKSEQMQVTTVLETTRDPSGMRRQQYTVLQDMKSHEKISSTTSPPASGAGS